MPTKAFVAILIASAAAALVLAYYSASWLWSIGNPAVALSGFDYHGGYFWTVVYVSTVVLWIIANVVLWQTRRAWALWSAFLFFAIFAFARLVVIDRIAAAFVESHRITTVSIYRYGALAFMLLFAAAAAITYFSSCGFMNACSRPRRSRVLAQPRQKNPPILTDRRLLLVGTARFEVRTSRSLRIYRLSAPKKR
jgi:hypothetical protein